MAGLRIEWEYLTGSAVATSPTSRERAEWPPHPARVFMAMAAAWFETGEDEAEGAALRWLENLEEPALRLPSADSVFERSLVTVFVPVNDKAGPSAAILESAPTITRSRQPRTFPCVWVGDALCGLEWRVAIGVESHFAALAELCEKVTRIGHSSSLVRMWAAQSETSPVSGELWEPDEKIGTHQLRRFSTGTLELLSTLFNDQGRQAHDTLMAKIDGLKAEKKATPKPTSSRKKVIEAELARLSEEIDASNPRPPIRPSLGLWSGYSKQTERESGVWRTYFDSDVLVLTHREGPRLPLASTQNVITALRGTVMSQAVQPPPAWVSGHVPSGEPLRNGEGHLALVPLPFVSGAYADGHLLGAAIVFPRHVDRRERGRVLGPMFVDSKGDPKPVELKLGTLGVWTLQKRDWSESREALTPETWTAHSKGCRTWASVTPVVFDKFPKVNRENDRDGWVAEMCTILSEACERIGLPKPLDVDFGTTCWHRGSPRSIVKRRTLRGQNGEDATLGDGFPLYRTKTNNAARLQMHVWLQFSEPIVGPIILGAGRFHGYGLCKPWKEPKTT